VIRDGLSGVADVCDDPFLAAQDEANGSEILRLKTPQLRDVARASDQETDSHAQILPLPQWTKHRPDAEPTPPRPLAPSRPVEAEMPTRSPLGDDQGYRFKRGNIIHALLQTLPTLPPHAQDQAARQYLANPSHGLRDGQQDDIAFEVLKILSDDQFAAVFAEDSQAEVPLVGLVGGRVISAQVDRLLIREDEVIVIDYKTNRPPPRTVRKVPDIYLNQMRSYHAALASIYPDRVIRCVLLWTDTPKLMEIPPEMLAT